MRCRLAIAAMVMAALAPVSARASDEIVDRHVSFSVFNSNESLALGDHDEVYRTPGPQITFSRFTGSSDRTLMLFPGAGHVFFLERQRATWIRMIAGWLDGHNL
jgi:alpha-beta hydrolase superfamily lysophospholipase